MSEGRVSVGVGSRAAFHLDRMVARMTALAGMQLKFEAVEVVAGTVVRGAPVEGEALPNGKPEVAFVVRTDDGVEYELRRSWVKFVVVTG